MTGDEMHQIRRSLDMTQVEFADLLRSTQTRISRLERTKKAVPEEIAFTLRYLKLEREAIELVEECGGTARDLSQALDALRKLLRRKR